MVEKKNGAQTESWGSCSSDGQAEGEKPTRVTKRTSQGENQHRPHWLLAKRESAEWKTLSSVHGRATEATQEETASEKGWVIAVVQKGEWQLS